MSGFNRRQTSSYYMHPHSSKVTTEHPDIPTPSTEMERQAWVWVRLLSSGEPRAWDVEGFRRWLRQDPAHRTVFNGGTAVTPLYAPTVPLYEAMSGVLLSPNQPGTMQQRAGKRAGASDPMLAGAPGKLVAGRGARAHIDGAHTNIDPDVSTSSASDKVTTWNLEAGMDIPAVENDAGSQGDVQRKDRLQTAVTNSASGTRAGKRTCTRSAVLYTIKPYRTWRCCDIAFCSTTRAMWQLPRED